ncbi:ABC transporter substrate-binding protein [Bauldia sp.]|uniref:ABC transporter substrate-binding protein n=1 Tax=Bauldia sp. TaxID=2575872 RepID=UPI0025B97479|nr:ABC transporter substrate-binding protein [Bauldia sp.]
MSMMRMTIAGAVAAAFAMSALPAMAADEDLTGALPDELKALYVNAAQGLMPSAYDDFKMPAKPWKWCHSESYQGNPWRVSVTEELHRLVDGLIEKGDVTSFEISDSNGDVSQQINQIRTFIESGCSIITSIPGSSTGVNDAIKAAYDAGIPFITASAYVTSPYAINVDSNFWRWGNDMMGYIAEGLDGKGSVLMVEGIAGAPIVAMEREGADAILADHPDLKAARSVNGNWTANVTKTVVLQTLATNPAPIDAVWTTGSESRVVAEAFAEAGRPAPLITGSITGDALGYWKANPDKYRFEGNAVLPGWTAQTLFRVGLRMLEGQKPKLNVLLIPIPRVDGKDLEAWYGDCMTPDSVSVFPVPPTDPMPVEMMNAYFTNPASIGFDYASVPGACDAE